MNKTTIANLNSFINTGKNAGVLLQVAKALDSNKPLPAWASGFSKDHFTKLFSLPKSKLLKICESDSYSDLRKVLNAYSSNKMSEALKATANTLLSIQSFTAIQDLKLAAAWAAPTITKDDNADTAPSGADDADNAANDAGNNTATVTATVTIEQALALFNQLSQADQLIMLDTLNKQATLQRAA